MTTVRAQVKDGTCDDGYIRFVLTRTQVQVGKTKKEAGAVYKARTDDYLLAEYQQPAPTPARSAGSGPKKPSLAALTRQRQKLENELTDARNLLRFAQTHVGYSPEQCQQAVTDVGARIS